MTEPERRFYRLETDEGVSVFRADLPDWKRYYLDRNGEWTEYDDDTVLEAKDILKV